MSGFSLVFLKFKFCSRFSRDFTLFGLVIKVGALDAIIIISIVEYVHYVFREGVQIDKKTLKKRVKNG